MVKEKLKVKYPGRENFDLDEILSGIGEHIFVETDSMEKELLKLADNLAAGKFRTNGKTKNDLYMFAFAFGMTSAFGTDDLDEPDAYTDIEKNLFEDYYNDNLLRYICTDYKEGAKRYEKEPSGEGINYKNFAEVIYLYFLNQKGIDAKEKIKQAESLIKECVKEGPADNSSKNEEQHTSYFKDLCIQITGMSRAEFKDFIRRNFKIPVGQRSAAAIFTDAETRTARECLKDICRKTAEENPDSLLYSYNEKEVKLDKISVDTMFKDYGIALDEMIMNYRENEDFIHLVKKLDEKLRYSVEKIRDVLNDKKNVFVTRTTLIAAEYYYFFTRYIEEREFEEIISLQELYDTFREFMDPYLMQSRFQKINAKNIYDMYVIAALYQGINFS